VLGAVGHAHAFERGVGPLAPLGRLHAAIDERQLDVLEDREVANEVEALEDEPDFAVAHARALGEREVGHLMPVQHVGAFGRRVEQAQDGQERRLAAARGASNGDVLALLDLQVDAGQSVCLDLVRVEDLLDPIQADERLR
jgi:hypothetical protein